MPIPYYLLKNANTSGGTSYRPVAQTTADATPAEFAAQIAARSGQKPEDVLPVLLAIGPVLGELLAAGTELDWPEFGLFKPNITAASVPSPEAQLPTTARGDAAFTPRGAFKIALDSAQFTRLEPPSHAPQWNSVTAPFATLTTLSGGAIVEVRGQNLDFNNDPTTRSEGIFLRPQSGAAAIPCPNVSVHTPQKINFQVTNGVAAGVYTLELHTRGNRSAASQPLETFIWTGVLKVV